MTNSVGMAERNRRKMKESTGVNSALAKALGEGSSLDG
jgi:hypothetical protein